MKVVRADLDRVAADPGNLVTFFLIAKPMPWRDELKNQHDERKANALWRQRVTVDGAPGREIVVDGKSYLNFCSNDYLGLANHPALSAAAISTIERIGTGSTASHLVCGHFSEHEALENEIAAFVQAERAIVFSTGFMANLAVPAAFLGKDDLIVQDRLNHASMIDAGRYCDAKMMRYQHLDLADCEKKLMGAEAKRKLVMTDGVFSMDGDIAPVDGLKTLCESHGAMLLVDDAHGFGVLGKHGRGTLEQFGLQPRGNILMMGTLGKAAGSFGAFVAGDAIYIESLIQYARTYIYTTALPPAAATATREAIKLIEAEKDRRDALHLNIKQFRELSAAAGLSISESSTAIQTLLVETAEAAIQKSERLKSYGIWVTAIRPPTVPTPRLRITLSAQHTGHDIRTLVNSLRLIQNEEANE